MQACGNPCGNSGFGYPFILVLFILLIIVLA